MHRAANPAAPTALLMSASHKMDTAHIAEASAVSRSCRCATCAALLASPHAKPSFSCETSASAYRSAVVNAFRLCLSYNRFQIRRQQCRRTAATCGRSPFPAGTPTSGSGRYRKPFSFRHGITPSPARGPRASNLGRVGRAVTLSLEVGRLVQPASSRASARSGKSVEGPLIINALG